MAIVAADAVDRSTCLNLTKYGTYENLVSSSLGCTMPPSQGSFKCYVMQMGPGVSNFPRKSVIKVQGSTLLALRGVDGV